MDDLLAKLCLAIALAGAVAPRPALADAGDDQYTVASGHYARGRWKLAIDEFAVYHREYPQHSKQSQALFFQAEAHVQLGEFDQARVLFRDFLKRDPKSRFVRQAMFRVGEASYMLGDNRDARTSLEAFRKQYASDSLNAFVLPYLGEIALADKDLPQAKELFDLGLKQFPDGELQDDCRFGQARVLEEQGQGDTAARIYLALAGKPGSPLADDAQFRLAAVQYAAGEYDEAVATLTEFETIFPDSELLDKARLSRGWAHFQLDKYDEARQLFQQLQQSQTVSFDAGYWLGLTHKSQNQWSEAAKVLLAVGATDAKHALAPDVTYHAGDALKRDGQAAAANSQFDSVLATWPKSDWADDSLLAKLQLAVVANDHQAVDQLAARFAKLFAESPLSADVERARAQSLVARKDFAQAAKIIAPLVAKGTKDKPAPAADRYLLALAYQGLAKHDEANNLLASLSGDADSALVADARLAQASVLMASKRFAEAVEPLEAYRQLQPSGAGNVRSLGQLAVCYGRINKLAEARDSYQKFVAQKPDQELWAATTQHLAEGVYAAGDYNWSAELFGSLAPNDKSDLPADVVVKGLSGQAWSQFKGDKLDAAVATFQRLLDKYPRDPLAAEAAATCGQILEKQQKHAAALAIYGRFIESYSADKQAPQVMLWAARLHDKLQQDIESAALYRRLTAEFPDETFIDAALYEWAWVMRDLNKPDQAEELFQRLRREHPESRFWADATYRLAEQNYAVRKFDDANKLLAELLAARPEQEDLPYVMFLRGQVATGLQKWPDVIVAMQRLVDRAPKDALRPLADYWVAEAEYRQGNYDKAGERLNELAERVAGRNDAWLAMVPLRQSQVLAQQKKWQEAQDTAAAIAERFPQFDQQFEADYVVGRALASCGEFEAARTAYQKVVRSATGGKTETAAMAQWMIGESYFHQKNYDLALREYLRLEILYAYPTWQAAALLQAGKCHEMLGQWKPAADLYQRLVKEYPQTSFVEEATRRLKTAQERVARKP